MTDAQKLADYERIVEIIDDQITLEKPRSRTTCVSTEYNSAAPTRIVTSL
jgi:hypothetical protein